MAFDEQGPADTVDRIILICKRSYDLLVNTIGFPPEDIKFDPNIIAVGGCAAPSSFSRYLTMSLK